MKMRSFVFMAAAAALLCAAPWSVKTGQSTSISLTTAAAAELPVSPRAYRRVRHYRSAYYDPFCGGPYVGPGWHGGSYWGGPWMDLRCYGAVW